MRRHLRWSNLLVVIASENALKSRFVNEEIRRFSFTGRQIVPISVGGEWEKIDWEQDFWRIVKGAAAEPEEKSNLENGTPSAEVIDRIKNSTLFTRQDQRLRRVVRGTVLGVLILIASAIGISSLIIQSAQSKERDANIKADAAEKLAIEKNREALDAEKRAGDAEDKRKQADSDLEIAKIAEAEAVKRRNDATREATRLRGVAEERLEYANKLNYNAQINLASSLYDEGNVDTMIDTLQESDRRRRGPEWDLLHHRTEGLVPFAVPPRSAIDDLVFSPDGKYLVTAGTNTSLYAWNPKVGTRMELPVDNTSDTERRSASTAFSNNGEWFASCAGNRTVNLWRITDAAWERSVVSLASGIRAPDDVERCKLILFSANSSQLIIVTAHFNNQDRIHKDLVHSFDLNTKQFGPTRTLRIGSSSQSPEIIGLAFGSIVLLRFDDDSFLVDLADEEKGVRGIPRMPREGIYAFTNPNAPEPRTAIMQLQNEGLTNSAIFIRSTFEAGTERALEKSREGGTWRQLVFSQDGTLLAAANSQEARVWTVADGKLVNVIRLRRADHWSINFSPDGTKLAIGGHNENGSGESLLGIWNSKSASDYFNISSPRAVSADGSTIVTAENGSLKLWSTVTRTATLLTAYTKFLPRVQISSDNNYVVAYFVGTGRFENSTPSDLRLWRTDSGTEIKLQIKEECKAGVQVGFTATGDELVNICNGDTLRIWSVKTGVETVHVQLNLPDDDAGIPAGRSIPGPIEVFRNGEIVAVSDPDDHELIGVWNTTTGDEVSEFCNETARYYSRDGKWLITVDRQANYRLRKVGESHCDTAPIVYGKQGARIYKLLFSNDSKLLAFVYTQDSEGESSETFVVKELITKKNILSERIASAEYADIDFSQNNRLVRFGRFYFNLSSGSRHALPAEQSVYAFSPDESRLLSGDGGNIKFWDPETGKEVLKLKVPETQIDQLLLMRDNKHLLAVGKHAYIWHLRF